MTIRIEKNGETYWQGTTGKRGKRRYSLDAGITWAARLALARAEGGAE